MGICITDTCIEDIESLIELLTEFLLLDQGCPWLGFCICKSILGAHACRIAVEKLKNSKGVATSILLLCAPFLQ
jgi:hypothetical protein